MIIIFFGSVYDPVYLTKFWVSGHTKQQICQLFWVWNVVPYFWEKSINYKCLKTNGSC